jgi:hypothetical protein
MAHLHAIYLVTTAVIYRYVIKILAIRDFFYLFTWFREWNFGAIEEGFAYLVRGLTKQ